MLIRWWKKSHDQSSGRVGSNLTAAAAVSSYPVAQWWVHSPPTNSRGPGSLKSRLRWHIIWVELVIASLLCSEGFSPGSPDFPLVKNKHFPNSNSTWNQVDEEALRGYATPKSLFFWFCFILFTRVSVLYGHCSFQPKIKLTLADLGGSEPEIVILSSMNSSYKLPFLSLVTCSRLVNAWDLSCLGYVILPALAKKINKWKKEKKK